MDIDIKYYNVLGVSRDASEAQIRKAYKKLVLKYHPDKNKSSNAQVKFQEIKEAYEILTNPEKRQQAPQTQNNQPSHSSTYQSQSSSRSNTTPFRQNTHHNVPRGFSNDFFNSFAGNFRAHTGVFNSGSLFEEIFNNTGFRTQFTRQFPESSDDSFEDATIITRRIVNIELSLEEMFQGKTIEFPYEREVIIDDAKYKMTDSVEVNIPEGCQNGHTEKLVLSHDDKTLTEITIKVNAKPHPIFTREKGSNNLEATIDISLKESLIGLNRQLKGIDGDILIICTNEVIDPSTPYKYIGKGFINKYGKRGDLNIHFNINYPTSLTPEQRRIIENIL